MMLLLNVLLALAWLALTGQFTPVNFVFGMALGYVMLWLGRGLLGASLYFAKAPRVVSFTLFYVWELIKANFRVALSVMLPRERLRPAIIAIPLEVATLDQVTVLANLITLTPGTLSLDVSDDRRVLYVHTMDLTSPDEFRREIKERYERRVMEVFE